MPQNLLHKQNFKGLHCLYNLMLNTYTSLYWRKTYSTVSIHPLTYTQCLIINPLVYIQVQTMHDIIEREISKDRRELGSNSSTVFKFLTFMLRKHQVGPKSHSYLPQLMGQSCFRWILPAFPLVEPSGFCSHQHTLHTWVKALNQKEVRTKIWESHLAF